MAALFLRYARYYSREHERVRVLRDHQFFVCRNDPHRHSAIGSGNSGTVGGIRLAVQFDTAPRQPGARSAIMSSGDAASMRLRLITWNIAATPV
jgi:hypothetical protein